MKKLSKWFLLACFSVGVVSGVAQPALAATTAKDVSSQPYSDLRKSILDSDSSNSIDEETQSTFKNKAGIVDQTKLSDKLNVVTGADGLTYVTLGDADTSKKTKQPKGSIEVGIDKKRQAKANAANESVNSFRDVNVNDIKSLQSALNNKNFPFLNEESGKYAANTYESELVHQKTKAYFVEKILDQTGNINDVPSTVTSVSPSMLRAVMSTSVQVGSANKDNDHHNNGLFNFGTLFSGTKVLAASNTNEYHITPPNDGAYLIELTQANGYLYSEQYGVYRIINGQSAFCIEPGVKSATSYTASNPRANMDMTEARKERIASYLTAYNEFGDWVQNQDGFYRWCAAQFLVWSALSPSYRPREAHMVPNSWKDPVQQKRNELQARADVILKSSTWNRTSQTVSKGNDATFTITNANNWGDYHVAIDSVSNGGTASFNGSTVTVDTSKATSNQIVVRMHKGADINKYRASKPTIWLNGSAQALFTGFLGMTTNLVVNVTPGQGQVQIVKRDSDSKQPLAGAKMRFSYNGQTKDIITGNDGVAKLPDMLNEGTSVNVTEIQAPSNYDLSSSTVTVKSVAGKTTSADFFNNESLGTGYVTKVDSLTGKPLAGVTFNFSYNGKSKNVTTGSDGVAALGENLHKGTVVKIKEVSTIAHYTLDSTEFSMTIQSGGNENIVRKNVPQGQVQIVKRDSESKQPLSGAKMRFSYNGQTKDIVTDKNGLALLPDWLDAGTVVNVTEVQAPSNYDLSSSTVTLKSVAGETTSADFFNKESLGTGYVTKVDSLTGKPLAGVTFNFSYNGKSKNVTTGSNGVAALGENLHKGTVVKIKEVSTIAHYTLDSTEFSMTIQSGGNENIVRKNVPQGQVGIYKKIRLLNEPIAGAKMRFSYNGQTKDIVTDKNGLALLPDWLDAGTVVKVTEVEAPAGFELSHDSVPVTVSAGIQRYGDFFDNINYDATVKKTVSDMDESQAYQNTWSLNQNDYLQYDVIGTLDLDGPFTLNKFVLTDYVDTQYVDIKSINVYDSKGAISNDFNISQSNGVITATAKPSLRSDKVSYNNKFILRTTMTIKPAFRNSTADRQSLTITKNGHLSLGISVSGHDTGVDYDSNSVTTYLTARSITSNHVKQDNPSSIFKTDVIHKYDGESYNINPYDKFMDGSLKYVPVDLNPQKGVVNGQNLNLTFLYFNPKLDINLDTIKITTAKAGTQLPISMNFSQNGDVDRLGAVQYKLNVLDQTYNKVAFDKTFTVKDGVPSENLALDVSYVKNKGEKIKYLFNISIIYNDGGSVKTDTINLTTYGYTSTEKVLTNSDSDSANKYLYTGVAQTQQSRSNNQYVEKMERLAFEFNPNYKSKSGYGLNIDLNPTFSSDINDKANMNVTASVPDKLVDSYLNDKTSGYASSNGMIQIPYENVNPTKTDTSEAMKFQFPHMNVEKNTGALFNDKQKANGDSNIKYKDGLRDGGHKFYLPIWANIDNYNYQLTSNTVGRNLVSVNLNAKINVYAQMYSTLDSKTTKDDQFLIEPVFPSMGNNDKQILGLSPSDWSWIKN